MLYQCNCGKIFDSPEERTVHSVSCPQVTKQELREKIAREVGQHAENCAWEVCSKSEQDAAYRSADFILVLIKEALPELAEEADCILLHGDGIHYFVEEER